MFLRHPIIRMIITIISPTINRSDAPLKSRKEQIGIINYIIIFIICIYISTGFVLIFFIVTLLVRIYRKHFPWFPDLWWLWGLEGRTSGTSRPTCLFGWRNIKVKKTSLGDTRWDIFDVQFPGGKACVFDMQFPGGKAYVLGMSLNMVWKMKSRLIYFKSLIQKRRPIRQDKTRRPMFTNLIPQVISFDWPLSHHRLLQSDVQITFCNLLLFLVDLQSTNARPKLNTKLPSASIKGIGQLLRFGHRPVT